VRPGSTVLMTADNQGGVLGYALDLARALGRRGVRVTVACMGGRLAEAQRREAEGVTVLESEHRLEWMDDPWEDVALAAAWLLDLEARLRPAIVHVNGLSHAALPFRAPAIAVVHSCVLSWWRAVRGEEAPARYDRYAREARAGLRAAAAVVAPTRAMLTDAERRYGPFRRALVVPNGVEAPPAPTEKEPLIFAAGRLWDEAKNVAALGRVAPRLLWPVVVAGSAATPIPGVCALGVLGRAEVGAWMGRASIYALPARYEPFGLSIVEAALSGCALVLGDIPSLREVWGEGAAIFVDPRSDAALEGALRALIEDRDLRASLARTARARALAYTPERTAAGYLAVYDALTGEAEAREESCA